MSAISYNLLFYLLFSFSEAMFIWTKLVHGIDCQKQSARHLNLIKPYIELSFQSRFWFQSFIQMCKKKDEEQELYDCN